MPGKNDADFKSTGRSAARWGLMLGLICLSLAPSGLLAQGQPAAASGDAMVTLRISTAKSAPLHKGIHSASTCDIFYNKNPLTPRDILAEPFFSQVKALNLQSLGYMQGAEVNWHHVVVGDTRIHGGKGDGYNINPADVKRLGQDIHRVSDGVGAQHFDKDFFNEYCALREKLGIPGAITANARSGTVEEILWEIERAHAERVVFGLELVTNHNQQDFPDGNAYVTKMTPWVQAVKMKYPNVMTVLDAAWTSRSTHQEWNHQIATMPGDQVRIYLWDRDIYASAKAKDAATRIETAFTQVIPEMIERIHKDFPGRKISVVQWGLKPGQERYDTMFGCLHVARMLQWMIAFNQANDNLIDYASFTNLTNLLLAKRGPACHYEALKLCGHLFEGSPRVLSCSIDPPGGVVAICCEEKGAHSLLILNENQTAMAIDSIMVDGSRLVPTRCHQEAIYGTVLTSNQIQREERDVEKITLRPYSVNLVRF